MENTTKFYVRLIGILFNPAERKILVGKNKEDEHFSFLDGELKYDEELDIGLKRVTKEKTGYEVHNLGAVFARNRINGENSETLELYFLCEPAEGQTHTLGEGVEEIKWIKAHEFEDLTNQKLPSRLKEYIINITG